MEYSYLLNIPQDLNKNINDAYRMLESDAVSRCIEAATLAPIVETNIRERAIKLIQAMRATRKHAHNIDVLLAEYSLSSDEGLALMCLAEALLRIPDKITIDKLIKDKLSQGNWQDHFGHSDHFFINATTLALMFTGKILSPEKVTSRLKKSLYNFVSRSSASIIRASTEKAMQIMGKQFVMHNTIEAALKKAKDNTQELFSYDMLGEAAITKEDAEKYFDSYANAIEAIGQSIKKPVSVLAHPGISIKLSALHPRYQEAQRARVLKELSSKLLLLAKRAKHYQINLTVDAEEADRLDLSLSIIEKVYTDPELASWDGFGLAIQAYQKRALSVIDWAGSLARSTHKRMMIRLVKGAYWDTEIKRTQMSGLSDYPVFTHKVFTDVSYQACAKKLLTLNDVIYPQFATHNAYTVAMIFELFGENKNFEFQALYGMGQDLYEEILNKEKISYRIYAPIGKHEDLLPYLVRRILENGANSSFVNRIIDDSIPIEELVINPIIAAKTYISKINQNIPLPLNIFAPQRLNSKGVDFSNREELAQLYAEVLAAANKSYTAAPTLQIDSTAGSEKSTIVSPQNTLKKIGEVIFASPNAAIDYVTHSLDGFEFWSKVSVKERASCLLRLAELYAKNQATLIYLLNHEAGKTLPDCVGEVREAIDFCRYYASFAVSLMDEPLILKGYTGEKNSLSLHPRGPLVCISPWNFPLAIFTGQIVASLVTGNSVIAKPAEQTPFIADYAIHLMHKAGIPYKAVQCLPGDGYLGAALTVDKRIKGVLFTGSTQTAHHIQLALTQNKHEIVPLIAETGGINAMIVDSSALLEQVVNDAITSAFGSAGQRCSALRVLYVQEEVFARCVSLLKGAMQEITIGDPLLLATDVGPIIDAEALNVLVSHVENMQKSYQILYQCQLSKEAQHGYFMPPTLIQINSILDLKQEVFGPILHIISYKSSALNKIIDDINSTGYGLTCGIHSRVNQTVEFISNKLKIGNCYVNRNMIGAVVGLQPFGGEGLSGTGPKAGGPYYLQRLCIERTLTVDTTAAGGNASLLTLTD